MLDHAIFRQLNLWRSLSGITYLYFEAIDFYLSSIMDLYNH